MIKVRIAFAAIAVFLLFCPLASADSVNLFVGTPVNAYYSVVGTYDANTPVTPFSSPGGKFYFGDAGQGCYPYPSGCPVLMAVYFHPVPSNVIFIGPSFFVVPHSQNFPGVPGTTLPTFMTVKDLASGGLFDLTVSFGGTTYTWVLNGDQAFTGTTADPTMVNGTVLLGTQNTGYFPVNLTNSGFLINGQRVGSFTTAVVNVAAPLPEPGTLLLLGTGLASICLKRKRRSINFR